MFVFLMVVYFTANTATRLLVRVFTQTTSLNPYTASFLIMAPTYIVGLVYGVSQQSQPVLQGVTPALIFIVFIVGMLQVVSGRIAITTQKHIETAPYTVMRMIFVPVSILISTLMLGESLSLVQTIGMVSILIGVSVVSTGGRVPHFKHIGHYEALTLINSVFLGAYVVLGRYLIHETSLPTLLIVFGGVELIPLIITLLKVPYTKPSRLDVSLAAGIGIASAVHIVAFWLAVDLVGNVALVSSLSAFRIVTIFIGSHIILKEKSNLRQKVAGSLLATVGLLLS